MTKVTLLDKKYKGFDTWADIAQDVDEMWADVTEEDVPSESDGTISVKVEYSDEAEEELIEQRKVKSNGFFGILNGPTKEHKYPEHKLGELAEYIELINFSSGEFCRKKIYENTKGKHFKHSSGYHRHQDSAGTHYLKDFTEEALYVPFQIIQLKENND